MTREETRSIQVGDLQIGHQKNVILQSMCNTQTKDIDKTIEQILHLETLGCQIIRMAIADEEDAKAIAQIKRSTHVPLVADIHYDHRLAIQSIQSCKPAGNTASRSASELTVALWKKTFMKNTENRPQKG